MTKILVTPHSVETDSKIKDDGEDQEERAGVCLTYDFSFLDSRSALVGYQHILERESPG